MKNKELNTLIRKYLGEFYEKHGFYQYGYVTAYKITNQIFQGILFDLSRWSDSFTLNIFVMPLFERQEFVGWNIGRRIKELSPKFDWWDIGTDEAGRSRTFQEVKVAIHDYAMPWLNAHDSPRKILEVGGARAKQDHRIELVYSFQLAHCALWEKDWKAAIYYLQLHDQWFESIDDRSDVDVKRNRIIKSFMKAIDSGEFQKIEMILQKNISFSMKALQFEKKTKKFRAMNGASPNGRKTSTTTTR